MVSTDAAHEDHQDEGNTDKVDYSGYSGLKEFMSETTMHGVQYIFRGAYLLRFVWFLGVLGALGAFLYFFVVAVDDFLGYPTNTKIDIVGMSQLPMPAVTICNSNIAQRSAVFDPVRYPYSTHNLAFACELLQGISGSVCPFNAERLNQLVETDNRTARDVMLDIGQNKTSLILDPLVRQITATTGITLETSSSFNTVVTAEGVCHTVNDDASQPPIARTGINAGLKLVVNVDQTQFAGATLLSAGVEVYIHPPGEPIARGRSVIYVGSGQRANIALRPRRRELLNTPGSPRSCLAENINRNKSKAYSSVQCLQECQEQLVAEECGCLSVSVPPGVRITNREGVELSEYCNASRFINCSVPVIASSETTNLSLACQNRCLPPCTPAQDQYLYDHSMSADLFPNVFVGEDIFESLVQIGKYDNSVVKAATNLSYLRENLAQINIYYDSLQFESIVELRAVTLSSLFGSVGGNLGLFLGASWITIIEFGQYFSRVILALVSNCRGKKKVQGRYGKTVARDVELPESTVV